MPKNIPNQSFDRIVSPPKLGCYCLFCGYSICVHFFILWQLWTIGKFESTQVKTLLTLSLLLLIPLFHPFHLWFNFLGKIFHLKIFSFQPICKDQIHFWKYLNLNNPG